jgi:hypothetical protein
MAVGLKVMVSGEQDGEEFACHTGEVVKVERDVVTIRFDDWNEGHGPDDREWGFYESDSEGWTITSLDKPAVKGPSTYLNGLDIEFNHCSCGRPASDQCPPCKQMQEAARPRFMTAWFDGTLDGDVVMVPTGHCYTTQEAAEAFAEDMLRADGSEGQIAIFELRSVRLARLNIISDVP